MDPFRDALTAHQEVIASLGSLRTEFDRLAQQCVGAIRAGGRLLWAGNGGSAADCQHLAAELVGRFQHERSALPAIALTTDSSILTAVANDYGFEQTFARQIEAIGRPGDVLIAISTSGNSHNILLGLEKAADLGLFRTAWTGETGGAALTRADVCLRVQSSNTARIQEAHILLGHMLCERIETDFAQSA